MTEDIEPLGSKFTIDGKEVPIEEFHFQAETRDPLAPLDNGEPGFYLTGLKEVSGTFSGSLVDGAWAAVTGAKEPIQMYLYGPDPTLPRWKHWWYKIREWVAYIPYPTIVLASGPATMTFEEEHEDGNDIVMTGTFTKAGTWTFRDEEVNP